MRVLELFSGSGVFSEVAVARGHEAVTVDAFTAATFQLSVMDFTPELLYERTGWNAVDVLWASPPCTGFSVASIGKSWRLIDDVPVPVSDTAREGVRLLDRTLELLRELRPAVFFIENPRGMMRRMPQLRGLNRVTVTYCQYGEEFMKPTDVWTNARAWWPKLPCRNGDACHVRAPRGSRSGLQGVRGAAARAVLPLSLCHEVLEAAETQLQ